jgi:ribosome-binding factor A
MSSSIRQQRVSEFLYEELSIMVSNELDDPSLSLVHVTNVEVSKDLRNVKVYVSHDDETVTKQQVLQGLKRASPYLRRQIALRASLRAVPELFFYYDDTPERASRVDDLLRMIAAERAARGETGDGGASGTEESSSDSPQHPTEPQP